MADERGRALAARVQFMERNGRALEELTAKMLRAREEQEAFLAAFGRGMQDVAAQEDCKALAGCCAALAECGQRLASETHEVLLQRPETEILHNISQIQDWGVVPIKRLLEDREKALKIEAKLQKEYDEIRRFSSAKEKEKKLRMLSDQKRRVENVNGLIDYHIQQFENYRLIKMKKIMTEFARSNAYYHAKGLELFATPCQMAAKIQPMQSGED